MRWDVSRHTAAHAVQNGSRQRPPPRPPVGPRRVLSGWRAPQPPHRTERATVRLARGARLAEQPRDPAPPDRWFPLARGNRGDSRGNTRQSSQTFLIEKTGSQMPNRLEMQIWIPSLNRMITRLGTDVHNHRILANRWHRKAQSMVKSWTVSLRYGHHPRPRKPRTPFRDWNVAATAMTSALQQRVHLQRTRTGWVRWASDRALHAHRWPGRFRQR